MAAGKANLYIEKGSNWSAIITLTQINGQPMILGGFTPKLQIKTDSTSITTLLTATCVVLDQNAGTVKASLTTAQTLTLPTDGKSYDDVSVYVYDVLLSDLNANTLRVLNGDVYVSPGVTTI